MMSNDEDILVEVKGVSKKFSRSLKRSMWYGLKDIGNALLGINSNRSALREGEFWAVKDVSFTLRRGECLGLIGHNGAGKSTLLKMLNGLIRPDEGSIAMYGKIGALIELGAGFNPLLTGRENIYVNAQLLGFSRKEINEKFQAIIEFADIGEFIDSPVQNYSSGMKVRLGFAVAAQMEPDILLIDEILAVGDVGFRIKCYNEIYRLLKKATIIFVSHSMPQVGKICTLGILLNSGRSQIYSPNIPEVINAYNNLFSGEKLFIEGSGKAKIHKIEFGNINNISTAYYRNIFRFENHIEIRSEEMVLFSIDLEVDNEINEYSVLIDFSDAEEKLVSQLTPIGQFFINKGKITSIRVVIDSLMLTLGNYRVNVLIYERMKTHARGESLLMVRNILKFSVKENVFSVVAPIAYNNAKWTIGDINE